MDLEKRFGFLNGCLFIRDTGICVASDLHIGLEDELRRQGLAFPLEEKQMLLSRIEKALIEFRPTIFVLAGDIFHSFDRLDNAVRDKFDSIMSMFEGQCKTILLRGSHDTMLSSLGLESLERYDADSFTFVHGHDNISDHGNIVLGHEHPVIQIEMERLPCFLFGEKVINGKDLFVLPAFNPLCQGVTINHVDGSDMLSPLLKKVNVEELCPVVEMQGEVLAFPKLRGLRKHIG
ncbi:MAG: metallophosphoesterase [Methanotrichaceae archaeon]